MREMRELFSSLVLSLSIDLSIPSRSSVHRRLKVVQKSFAKLVKKDPRDIVISLGAMEAYEEGEWNVSQSRSSGHFA